MSAGPAGPPRPLIALGVSGGIAAYKACELVRALDREGLDTQVLLTKHGARFVAPLALQTLSRRPVWSDPFTLDEAETIRHIELTRRIAAFVVAPATANVLAKLARGVADDMLSTFHLAVTAPVLVAPAMNPRMLLHPATQENLRLLAARGTAILEPEHGWLAEGEVGWGRMMALPGIVQAVLLAVRRSRQLAGQTVLVTAGPTREALDPVRFISNRSSGKMGYALAAACARRGAQVLLVSGPSELAPPYGVDLVRVESCAAMREQVLRAREGAAAVFMAAAVSDYVPAVAATGKLKRSGAPLRLDLAEAPDILGELGAERRERVLVGFAAETENLLHNARQKLERKNLDFIVANDVSLPGLGFGSDRNAVTILDRAGGALEIPAASKVEVAEAILDRVFGGGPVA